MMMTTAAVNDSSRVTGSRSASVTRHPPARRVRKTALGKDARDPSRVRRKVRAPPRRTKVHQLDGASARGVAILPRLGEWPRSLTGLHLAFQHRRA